MFIHIIYMRSTYMDLYTESTPLALAVAVMHYQKCITKDTSDENGDKSFKCWAHVQTRLNHIRPARSISPHNRCMPGACNFSGQLLIRIIPWACDRVPCDAGLASDGAAAEVSELVK